MRVFEKKVIEECYLSLDGIEFSSEEECKEYDKLVLSKIRSFKITLSPDRHQELFLFFAVYDSGGFDSHYIEQLLNVYRSYNPLLVGLQGIFNISQIDPSEYVRQYTNEMFCAASSGRGLSNMRFYFLSEKALDDFPDPIKFQNKTKRNNEIGA